VFVFINLVTGNFASENFGEDIFLIIAHIAIPFVYE
jgi:hypothetical protein